MPSLGNLVAGGEGWLVDRVLLYAKRHGYSADSSTLEQPWRESIRGFSAPMLQLLASGDAPVEIPYDAEQANPAIAGVAVEVARRHRQRGVSLGPYLGLLKYYRQAFVDLVLEGCGEQEERERNRAFVDRFFDNVEVLVCRDWLAVDAPERLAEVERQNRVLLNEKTKYLTILESIHTPIIVVDAGGTLRELNHAATLLFDERPTVGSGYYATPAYPMLVREIDRLLRRKDGASEFQTSLETVTGPRSFDVNIRPLVDLSEKHVGRVIILTDVTDYERAKREADAASRAKSRFLATISHEIRTPINGIIGIGHLLQEGPFTDEQRRLVKALLSSGELLIGLVDDVLDYTHAEHEPALHLASIRLEDLFGSVVDLTLVPARQKGLSLDVAIAASAPETIIGDVAKIRRILVNFATNAIKYTASGTVTLACEVRDRAVRLLVRDTGPGVPDAIRDTLFEPFRQHDPQGEAGAAGVGLGLAICKRLATAMEGDVGFECAPGEGSAFWLDLPRLEAPEISARAAAAREVPALPALDVLVVEDDAVNILVIEGLLEREGHTVALVENGEAAVEAVLGGTFDIVLMDIHMKGRGGLEAIRRIRACDDARKAATPILVVTADLATASGRSGREFGADGLLVKPFGPNDLRGAMAAALGRTEASERPRPADSELLAFDPSVMARLKHDLGSERAESILRAFLKTAPETARQIQAAAGRADGAAVADFAHALQSGANVVGLYRLGRAADRLERDAIRLGRTALARAATDLDGEITVAMNALAAMIIAEP